MLNRFILPILILLISLNLIIFNTDFYKHEMQNYNEDEISNLLNYFKGSELNQGYSAEETIHLKDVRNLIWFSWILIIIFLIILYFSSAKDIFQGSIISIIITSFLPLLLFTFNSAFILFHKLLFTNNYWLLPESSKLIQMFPETFFIEATKQLIFNNLILSLFSLVMIIAIKKSIK